MKRKYLDFENNRIVEGVFDDGDFFRLERKDNKARALFKEIGLFCQVSYTDGVPVPYIARFRSSLLELEKELAGLERRTLPLLYGAQREDLPCEVAEKEVEYSAEINRKGRKERKGIEI